MTGTTHSLKLLSRAVVATILLLLAIFLLGWQISSSSPARLEQRHLDRTVNGDPRLPIPGDIYNGSFHSRSIEQDRPLLIKRVFGIGSSSNKLTDKQWKDAQTKGKKLQTYMQKPDSAGSKATSEWMRFDEMKTWGWGLVTKADPTPEETVPRPSVQDLVADYSHTLRETPLAKVIPNINLENGLKYDWLHAFDRTYNGQEYPHTNAQISNVYWPAQGIIFANDNYSPEHMVTEEKNKASPAWSKKTKQKFYLPELQKWSDINFLSYLHACLLVHTHPNQLRYIVRRNVKNDFTKKVLAKIIKNSEVKEGQVFTFTAENKGFEALLSMPNVQGVCWLLIQHQAAFGRKEVKRITVWRERGAMYAPSFLVEIGDVDEGK